MSRKIVRGTGLATLAVAVLVLASVILPRIGYAFGGAAGIHDAATLPEHISICGRDWRKGALGRPLGLIEIRARAGVDPVVVDPAPFAPCPPGPCTTAAQEGSCDTVIYVRVGEDAFLDYSLQGGP
jgi:hypothetical protein